jgi:hypothetical protein
MKRLKFSDSQTMNDAVIRVEARICFSDICRELFTGTATIKSGQIEDASYPWGDRS